MEVERFRTVPMFAGLSDADLELLCRSAETITLGAGTELFREGDAPDFFYLITSGQVEILKHTSTREVLLAVLGEDDFIGEMAILEGSPRSASARARTDVELVSVARTDFDDLLAASVEAVRVVFEVVLDRWKSTQAQLAHTERMAQLGTLTAGLAHELNNPAAAVGRAAGRLGESVERLVSAERSGAGLPGHLTERVARLTVPLDPPTPTSPVDRAELESRIEQQLQQAGVADAWRLGPALVEAGLAEQIDDLLDVAGQHAPTVIELIVGRHQTEGLLREIQAGVARLSELVRAVGSYSYLDRGALQSVDLARSLDDTLLILGGRLEGISVDRRYHPDLAPITARGAELNQVWTNLIVNAAEAVGETGRPDGEIVVRATPVEDSVVVEVEDNGTGISPDVLPRVFDSFYTTKPPGAGTGLGLNISYQIVRHHGGDLTVESVPGKTVFRVTLPSSTPP